MESTIYTVNGMEFELQHYGVKGMKWGHRKAREEYAKLDKAGREYRRAGRMYRRAAKTALKNDVLTVGNAFAARKLKDIYKKEYNDAKKAYKEQKKNVRANTTAGQKAARAVTSALRAAGSLYVADVMLTGGAVTRATVKVGKAAVKSTLNKVGDQMFDYTLLDKDGRPIKRYN